MNRQYTVRLQTLQQEFFSGQGRLIYISNYKFIVSHLSLKYICNKVCYCYGSVLFNVNF